MVTTDAVGLTKDAVKTPAALTRTSTTPAPVDRAESGVKARTASAVPAFANAMVCVLVVAAVKPCAAIATVAELSHVHADPAGPP